MLIDATFDFGLGAHTAAGSVVSTNRYDALSAKILFQAGKGMRIWGRQALTAGTGVLSLRAEFRASSETDLDVDDDTAGSTEVLASSGDIYTDTDGTALANTDVVEFDFEVSRQHTARRHYGLVGVLGGGGTPAADAGEAYGVFDAQTNMRAAQAAVPAT